MNIPNKLVSACVSSSPSTAPDATELRLDGGGVGRLESGLYVREKYSKSKSSSSSSKSRDETTLGLHDAMAAGGSSI